MVCLCLCYFVLEYGLFASAGSSNLGSPAFLWRHPDRCLIFRLCLAFLRLRGVAQGVGVVAENHRAAGAEDFHVQAGAGRASPGVLRQGLRDGKHPRCRFRPGRKGRGQGIRTAF